MIMQWHYNCLCDDNNFVKRSAKLKSGSLKGIVIPAATLSLTLWKHTELCFLVSQDSAKEAFLKTDLLSQNTLALPSIGSVLLESLIYVVVR